jgi:hypothetical protein
MLATGAPSISTPLTSLIYSSRRAIWWYTARPFGSNRRAISGESPTEKEATVASMDIYRIVDGRIVEQWNHPDRFGLMYQLGNLPTPL